jgi:acyl carrier protein
MRQVIAAAQERFGPIHGVIHAAGVLNEKAFDSLEKLSKPSCQEQFKAKIHGVQVLENLLEGKPLDFCLSMSSLSSLAGGLGHGAYAAANSFMDAFVYKHHQNHPGSFPWIGVNWDRWNTQTEEPALTALEKSLWAAAIQPQPGIEAFERIVSWNRHPQVVVSTGNLQTKINQPFHPEAGNKEKKEKEKTMAYTRPNISTPFAAPETDLEQLIAGIWQELLGIEHIGVNDNFFDLGATSMVMIQAHKKITEKLGKNIPLDVMFEYPTINVLLGFLSDTNKSPEIGVTNEKLTRAANRAKKASRRLREK